MKWNEQDKKWILREEPKPEEQIAYPESNGAEYSWRVGVETLKERIDEVRVRDTREGKRIIEIIFRLNGDGVRPKTFWDNKLFNATAYGTSLLRSIMGVSQSFSFPKSVYAVEECIRVCDAKTSDIILDFFAGSGTTAHAVINLNREDGGRRKYILVEMAEYFNTVLLLRIKKVIFTDDWKDGKAQPGQGVSHFLKYYELEQYEDTLRIAKYDDSDLLDNPYEDPYSQYVFMRDTKLLDALEIDYKNNKVKVDLSKLYKNIDIPETLSNLTGKWIKRITEEYVEFDDGEKINIKELDYKLIKPLIWW
jgi:adenine-specific DNA-methyltransferase